MKKLNLDLVQVAELAGSLLTIGATILTGYANEKKLDAKINEKVAEAIAEQLAKNSIEE